MKCRILFPLFIVLTAFCACKRESGVLPGSGGKTCEIIVVTPARYWQGDAGDTIRSWFQQIQPCLNQPEPLFGLVNIQPSAFNESSMFQHHRNVLVVEWESGAEPKFECRQDVWAFPQAVVKFTVPDKEGFYRLFGQYKRQILQLFYVKEYQRIQKVFKQDQNTKVSQILRDKYGFDLVFPHGFDFAVAGKEWGWVRQESKHYGQGISFTAFPYTDVNDFEPEKIIERRNRLVGRIPGPADSSYMTTELAWEEFYPVCKPLQINGLYAVETRGLWKLEGDFMGGPFVNYLIADTAAARLVMLDCYLYSPRKPKRDLLIQLEAVARSFRPVGERTSGNRRTDLPVR